MSILRSGSAGRVQWKQIDTNRERWKNSKKTTFYIHFKSMQSNICNVRCYHVSVRQKTCPWISYSFIDLRDLLLESYICIMIFYIIDKMLTRFFFIDLRTYPVLLHLYCNRNTCIPLLKRFFNIVFFSNGHTFSFVKFISFLPLTSFSWQYLYNLKAN